MAHQLGEYKTFIFDWDGTIQSLRTILMINEALKSIVRDTKGALEPKKVPRRNYSELNLKRLIELEKIDNSFMSYVLDLVLWLSRPKMRNDVLPVLRALHSRGRKIVIFSNANKHRLTKEIKLLGLSKYLDVVVSARNAGAPKPNPLGLEVAIKLSKTRKSECIYIGDMVTDILVARAAGIASCAVAGGFDRYSVLQREKPDYLYRSMEELLRKGLGKRA